LNSTRRLFVSESAWSQLADHFALVLSECDSASMSSVESTVDKWHLALSDFDNKLRSCEDSVQRQLMVVTDEIRRQLESDVWYSIELFYFTLVIIYSQTPQRDE